MKITQSIPVLLFLASNLIACSKDKNENVSPKEPSNYAEIFASLELKSKQEYRYEEWVTYSENGTGWASTNRNGFITFDLTDTTMTERYNGFTTKDKFRLSNFFLTDCDFESLGYKKYGNDKSVFINDAWQNMGKVNGQIYVGWATKYNGVYKAVRLKILPI